MATEKMMDKSLSLTFEGTADFSMCSIWLHTSKDFERLAEVVRKAIDHEESEITMRCRIQLTIDRLPDDKLEVEVN